MIPFTIDNTENRLADVLNDLLSQTEGRPFDVATAYLAVSGYPLAGLTDDEAVRPERRLKKAL